MIQVKKRAGQLEELDLSKIERVLVWASEGLSIDYRKLFNSNNYKEYVYNGIPTQTIQDLLANQAATKIVENFDWDVLASRLVLQKIRKEAHQGEIDYCTFSEYLENVSTNSDKKLNDGLGYIFDLDIIDQAIDAKRDYLFTHMGITILQDRYLLRDKNNNVIEAPQHFFMRVAMGLALKEENPTKAAIEIYDVYSKQEFLSSTPTLFNSATNHPQLSSCFISMIKDDSLEGIFDTHKDVAYCSKFSGGTANSYTPVRGKGSLVKSTGGKSSGVVPYLKMGEQTVRSFDQGGKRPGVMAAYLEVWHKDIFDFLRSADPSVDERIGIRDINLATWINDLFMERVDSDEDWTLLCPSDCPDLHDLWGEEFEIAYLNYEATLPEDKKVVVKARDVFAAIIKCLFNNKGNGWPCFKDTINRRSMTRGYGVVHSSNLCVAPETKVLTDVGHVEIRELEGQKVNVWNGKEFSKVNVVKTSENSELLKVTFDNGVELSCTPYHKFYVQENYNPTSVVEVRAKNLTSGMKLIKSALPIIKMEDAPDFEEAYTHGFFCGDGTYDKTRGTKLIRLYDDKKKLVDYLDVSGSGVESANGVLNCNVLSEIEEKFVVPSFHSLKSRINWLAGWLDADGTIAKNGDNISIQAASTSVHFLREIKLMLQTLGVDAKIKKMREESSTLLPNGKGGEDFYDTQTIYRFLINSTDTQLLLNLGLNCQRLDIDDHVPQRNAKAFVKVVSVEDEGREDATYCFTENKRHMGTFNGILTGNCTEITIRNSSDRTSVCNLGSINLSKIKTKEQLENVVRVGVRAIDNAVENGFVPIESGKLLNLEDRPLGLGVMGYTEFLSDQGIPFESYDHLYAADVLFEYISYIAIDESSKLGKSKGNFPMFEKSQWAKGELPQDTAYNKYVDEVFKENEPSEKFTNNRFFESLLGSIDWDELRLRSSKNMRNSLLLAVAPNATISNILGTTPCIELPMYNVYQKENKSGDFTVISPLYLKHKETPELCKTLKGETAASQYWQLMSNAVRQRHIDQAQSFNVWVEEDITPKELASIYRDGWRWGNKTFYYLRADSPDSEKSTDTEETNIEQPPTFCDMSEGCESCQ